MADPYPHHYVVTASGSAEGNVALRSAALPDIASAPPAQFGGPGDQWSPETLLCAALADCLILTWRAVARASKFDWTDLECAVDAVLDREEGVTRFTHCVSRVTLTVPAGADEQRAHALMEKAERGCLIANSLLARRTLELTVRHAP